MTDPQQLEDDFEEMTPRVDAPKQDEQPDIVSAMPPEVNPATKLPAKAHVGTVERIMPIACTNIEEAYRTAEMFCYAGMIPRSYAVDKRNERGVVIKGDMDWKATASRMTVAILAGSEVGFGPAASLKNIAVINGLATIFGQGAKALVQHSGALEWEKIDASGSWQANDYTVTVSLKRRGQEHPYVKSFGKQDAQKAGLLARAKPSSPWQAYPERQTYWRAWTWAARDGFSDALMGLTIAEELEDYAQIEAARQHTTDTSSLEDAAETNAAA
jgi:hypothetical protein